MTFVTIVDGVRESIPVGTDFSFQQAYDVIVAGLGTAGVWCTLAAAERVSVLAVESGNTAGGTSTAGMVCSYYDGVAGGAYQAADVDAEKNACLYRRGVHNPYTLQYELTKRLDAFGAVVAYDSVVIGVYLEGTTVIGVRILTPNGIKDVGCRFLCDCTGDGYVVRLVAERNAFGRESDGSAAPYSLIKYYRENGEIKSISTDAGYVNPYDAQDFSRAVLTALLAARKAVYPRVVATAPLLGVRESFRFVGEYTLTLDDIILEKETPRPLLCIASDVDRHGDDFANDSMLYRDWRIHANLSTVSVKVPLPLDCLIPKGLRGIMTACRCISADSYACAVVRMRRDMQRLGECAGVAAAMTVSAGKTSPCELEYDLLHNELIRRGCFDGEPTRKRGFIERHDGYRPITWLTAPDEIVAGLQTDRPGAAIWSCFKLGNDAPTEALLAALTSDNSSLRTHAAFALGITCDRRSLPVLRACIAERTDTYMLDCRRNNQIEAVTAISLCGKMKDADAVPLLTDILRAEEYEKPFYHAHMRDEYLLSTSKTFNVVYYSFISFTLRALREICDATDVPLPQDCIDVIAGFLARKETEMQKLCPNQTVLTPPLRRDCEALFALADEILALNR